MAASAAYVLTAEVLPATVGISAVAGASAAAGISAAADISATAGISAAIILVVTGILASAVSADSVTAYKANIRSSKK